MFGFRPVSALSALLLCITLPGARSRQPLFIDKVNHVVTSYRLARDLVDARWNSTWSQDLPCRQPRVNGFQSKIATGTQSPTIGMSIAEAEQFTFEKLPIYAGCQVHISHKWKFIFVRQPKSSSTAIMVAIKEQLCGLANPKHSDKCKRNEFTEAHTAIPDAIWNEYFVFTVVRNPWVRMLSAYNMFMKHFLRKRTGEDGRTAGQHCGTSFTEYTSNSNSLRQLCPSEDCCAYISTLNQFVPHFIDQHINDQAHCVFLPGGESLVDYIGATETVEEDWPRILGEINMRAGTAFEPRPITNPNGHGSGDDAHSNFAPDVHMFECSKMATDCEKPEVQQMFNETTLHNIARQYAMDIVRYGFM